MRGQPIHQRAVNDLCCQFPLIGRTHALSFTASNNFSSLFCSCPLASSFCQPPSSPPGASQALLDVVGIPGFSISLLMMISRACFRIVSAFPQFTLADGGKRSRSLSLPGDSPPSKKFRVLGKSARNNKAKPLIFCQSLKVRFWLIGSWKESSIANNSRQTKTKQ